MQGCRSLTMLGAWSAFVAARAKLPAGDLATTVTRERWLLPLFQELGYGRLIAARAVEIEGKSYAVSHFWQKTPIHLVGAGVDLDHRTPGVSGAARTSPHSLVQELLNRNPSFLWAFISNGLTLRILRDNVSLTRQAYVEFDLKSMMDGEVYSDFVLLWLLCQQSRVEAERPHDCWLEKWSKSAQQQGTRALDELRNGVEAAIVHLGHGFLSHPQNASLREKLQSGTLSKQDYYRQLLRVVYRLLFLFVAEDRQLLLDPQASVEARDRYSRFYSTARLRQLSERVRGTQHGDLWEALGLVLSKLGQDTGCPELALPTLGSFLWSERATPDLDGCGMANSDLLEAIRELAFTIDVDARRPVDYKNLGSEELGSIYESLLELHPELNVDARTFELSTASGHERRTTGGYYTPTSLINCLLDSALEPVLQEAARKPNWQQAILNLKVCDPACGSGHFLIAAAHRIARRLARLRTNDEEPSPEALRTSLRDVIGHCIYGVDINPMAVELCKVGLWLEALEPGKPLSFLEHRVQCGNSLLGATPALLAQGIPDEVFTPIEGDDVETCKKFKKINRKEREITKQKKLDFAAAPWEQLGNLASGMMNLDSLSDGTIEGIRQKQQLYEQTVRSSDYLYGRFWADAWCAAFVWKKTNQFPFPITEEIFRHIQRNPHNVETWMREEVIRLAKQFRFFHWQLAFPDVFRLKGKNEKAEKEQAGWSGGFDVVLSNPPWERVKLQEKEWFAQKDPGIANAPNAAARKRLIEALKTSDPTLYRDFLDDSREAEGQSHLIRNSGRYPLCGRGDINVYSVFTEGIRNLLGPTGRAGCVIPSGIATDDTTKFFFQDLVTHHSLVSLYDFENVKNIFPGVGHGRFKFCLLTLSGSESPVPASDFVFFAHQVEDLGRSERHFTLTARDIELINPNTFTCAMFSSTQDAEIAKHVYRRSPILIREGPPEMNSWRVTFMRMLDMANDSGLFQRTQLPNNVPLYEAKMVWHFDHRYGDYADYPEGALTTILPDVPKERLEDPRYASTPRYWVERQVVLERLRDRWGRDWLLGWRDVTHSTNDRTLIASVIPWAATNNKFLLMFPSQPPRLVAVLLANLNSFILDFTARQKVGGLSLNYFIIKQLPVLEPATYEQPCAWEGSGNRARSPHPPPPMEPGELNQVALRPTERAPIPLGAWLLPRVIELVYTAWDLETFACDCGSCCPPFRWDEERRFLLRCELDAAFFHLYLPSRTDDQWKPARIAEGTVRDETPEELAELRRHFATSRDAAAYIMDTFPLFRRKNEENFGEYRTKRVILEIYDAMAEAMRTGTPYQTRLDPPPADPRCCHPRRKVGILAFGSLINDPGEELQPKITMRIKTETPFPVEYGRYSGTTRGGAPTLVPHECGSPVTAEFLVLDDAISVEEARDMLWRRERRRVGSGERYVEGTSCDSVLVRKIEDSPWVTTVLYTDFPQQGKIPKPTPKDLATRAIKSVRTAKAGKDGITYLMNAIALGINTLLTEDYKAEILTHLRVQTLLEALEKARTQ